MTMDFMSCRRLLALGIAIAVALPALLAGMVAVHVAFDHAGDHADGHGPGLPQVRAAAPAAFGHSAAEAPHRHAVSPDSSAALVRRALDVDPLPSAAVAAAAIFEEAELVPPGPAVRAILRPPKANGPPLLARLSTLRI